MINMGKFANTLLANMARAQVKPQEPIRCWICDAQPAPYVEPDGGQVCLKCAATKYADTRDTREHREEAQS